MRTVFGWAGAIVAGALAVMVVTGGGACAASGPADTSGADVPEAGSLVVEGGDLADAVPGAELIDARARARASGRPSASDQPPVFFSAAAFAASFCALSRARRREA